MALKKNPGYEWISKINFLEEELAKNYVDWLGASDKYSKEFITANPDIFSEPEDWKLKKKKWSER